MRRSVLALVLSSTLFATFARAGDRVPGEHWLRYVDPNAAGFDPEALEAARKTWEALPSSAFLVIADGAVVAAWGDVERRFMCHSVRKSFLAGLYGIYWDRGEIELNKTLADLGLDDEPDPLLETEKQARILDLLKARSGVFHPAAYAGRTDSRPRGSEGPGRYFAYNNWDFNTLATILEMETGDPVFEAFDEHFGRPLGMEDWRVSDGYYHYERDKSKYPAYPFRMSARDAARFGLLFTRGGMWGDQKILSKHWVDRCSALYSIDDEVMGYGFMWWVFREPRFERHGMFAARGVGNQMIVALPEIDLVIVNRANTFAREGTPNGPLLDLIESILEARTGEPVAAPELVPLERKPADPRITHVAAQRLQEFVGSWKNPAPPLQLPARQEVELTLADGHIRAFVPTRGTFDLYLQDDGSFHVEDSEQIMFAVRDAQGAFQGLADDGDLFGGALALAGAGELERARELLTLVRKSDPQRGQLGTTLVQHLEGQGDAAIDAVRKLAAAAPAGAVEGEINATGYLVLGAGLTEVALSIFELNTLAFPESFNAWDSLAEAHWNAGNEADAIAFYEYSLSLNAGNANARTMLARIREAAATQE